MAGAAAVTGLLIWHANRPEGIPSVPPIGEPGITNRAADSLAPDLNGLPSEPAGEVTTAPAGREEKPPMPTEQLTNRPGELFVDTEPWVDIYVNGKAVDTTPLQAPIQLFAGEYDLKLVNPAFPEIVRPLSIKAGADFPRWILQLWQRQNPRISLDGWRDGLVMLRYDEAVWHQI